MLADFFRTNTYLSLLASRFQRYMHSPFGVSQIASTCRACCRDRRATRFAHIGYRVARSSGFGAALPTRIFVKGAPVRSAFFLAFTATLLIALPAAVAPAGAAQSNLVIASPTRLGGGILPADRDASANWRMAGMLSVRGIPNRTTVCASISPLGEGRTIRPISRRLSRHVSARASGFALCGHVYGR